MIIEENCARVFILALSFFIGNNSFSDLLFGVCHGLEIWMKQVHKGK